MLQKISLKQPTPRKSFMSNICLTLDSSVKRQTLEVGVQGCILLLATWWCVKIYLTSPSLVGPESVTAQVTSTLFLYLGLRISLCNIWLYIYMHLLHMGAHKGQCLGYRFKNKIRPKKNSNIQKKKRKSMKLLL